MKCVSESAGNSITIASATTKPAMKGLLLSHSVHKRRGIVWVPVLILKAQVRIVVSSISYAVEVVTSISIPNTWTEDFKNSWMVPVSMALFQD